MTKYVKLNQIEHKIAKKLGINDKKATLQDQQKIQETIKEIKKHQVEGELLEVKTYLIIEMRLVKIIAIVLLFLIMMVFLYLININTIDNRFDF